MDTPTPPAKKRNLLRKLRWMLPPLLATLCLVSLLFFIEPDAYGRCPRRIGWPLIYFMKWGIAPAAALLALSFAKNLKDLLVNMCLVAIPMLLVYYPFGWLILFLDVNVRYYDMTALMIVPQLLATFSLIAAPVLCILVGVVFRKQYPRMNFIAKEALFWSLTIFPIWLFIATLV